jgi:hypothetical protein
MTTKDKIEQGILQRDIVESILKKYKEELKKHKSHYENLTGFARDSYVNQNNIQKLNSDIDTGVKILETMTSMGV